MKSSQCYYVTVKVSPIDQVDRVVEAALARLEIRDDPENYLIAKCIIPAGSILDHCPPRERGTFMEYDECPLDVLNRWDQSRGVMVLVLQPPPPTYVPKKQRRKRVPDAQRPLGQVQQRSPGSNSVNAVPSSPGRVESAPLTITIADGIAAAKSPALLEVIPPGLKALVHNVWPSVTEVGFVPTTSYAFSQYIKLPQNPGLLPRHCVLGLGQKTENF